jgi:hypothetical protein
VQFAQVHLNSVLKSEVKRVRDEGMPYGYLHQPGYVTVQPCKIIEVKVMAGIYAKPASRATWRP